MAEERKPLDGEVYRARVKGKIGWSLVMAYEGGFWVEDIGYLVQADQVEIFGVRVLPPWPLVDAAGHRFLFADRDKPRGVN